MKLLIRFRWEMEHTFMLTGAEVGKQSEFNHLKAMSHCPGDRPCARGHTTTGLSVVSPGGWSMGRWKGVNTSAQNSEC